MYRLALGTLDSVGLRFLVRLCHCLMDVSFYDIMTEENKRRIDKKISELI